MNRSKFFYCCLFCQMLLIGFMSCRNQEEKVRKEFAELMDDFASQYPQLNIPSLELSYVKNFQKITSLDSIQIQSQFFQSFQDKLKQITIDDLEVNNRSDYETISLELALHLERLELEKIFQEKKRNRPLDQNGLYFIPNGKKWYRYFIKRWIGAEVTPEDLKAFGLTEIEKIKRKILKIQRDLNFANDRIGFYEDLNQKRFLLTDSMEVVTKFKAQQTAVRAQIWNQFSSWNLSKEKIDQGKRKELSRVPGYYDTDEKTFYFNLFDEPFNIRQVDWLYLHEGVPGHHFQMSLEKQLLDSLPTYRAFIPFSGYREGWAAYAEEIGSEVGLYQTPYDWMGKHEWDLIRSVRVVLDVALNYQGWSDEKALTFWKKHIYNQDDIAEREIERMKKWPGQVHTYKYGAAQILQLKEVFQKEEGSDFDIRKFHDRILDYGPLHWKALRKRVLEEH